jgi:hypothetical protein
MILLGKVIDLTGQKFGRLTVLYQNGKTKNRSIIWHCKCDCGKEKDIDGHSLRRGKTKSCGCLNTENHIKDITGQRFGRLVALELISTTPEVIWKCKCDCGNIISVKSKNLNSNHYIQSCGCLKKDILKENIKNRIDNLEGKTFGYIKVIKMLDERKNNHIAYQCLCTACGNAFITDSTSLRVNNIQSCGCIKSKGELIISKILNELNISYEREKTFKTCIFPDTKYLAKFDFYLPDYNLLIEYDGVGHFKPTANWDFEQTKRNDKFKNQWCKENNIPLIRIPYTDFNKISTDYLLNIIEENPDDETKNLLN